jgi:hypothetical protein
MLAMTTPIVTELPLRMEPVTADSFLDARGHAMDDVEGHLATVRTLPQWRRRLARVRGDTALAA